MKAHPFVGKAIRRRLCSCCGNTIEPDEKHFQYSYQDGTWGKALNLCWYCLRKIYREVKPCKQ